MHLVWFVSIPNFGQYCIRITPFCLFVGCLLTPVHSSVLSALPQLPVRFAFCPHDRLTGVSHFSFCDCQFFVLATKKRGFLADGHRVLFFMSTSHSCWCEMLKAPLTVNYSVHISLRTVSNYKQLRFTVSRCKNRTYSDDITRSMLLARQSSFRNNIRAHDHISAFWYKAILMYNRSSFNTSTHFNI